jgi:Gpi18-like mannosyltransferase
MLGTLAAMLALYDLAKSYFGESTGMRAAFYLLIFPASMFLAQVYTEDLFLGLSFTSLALMKSHKWLPAALLAGLSVFTKAAGTFLLVPLLIYWWQDKGIEKFIEDFNIKEAGKLLLVFTPAFGYFLWANTFGKPFWLIEKAYFNRDSFKQKYQ